MLAPKYLLERLYSSYILLFSLFLLIGWGMFPPLHNVALQLGMWITGFVFSYYTLKYPSQNLTFIVFLYQAFFIVVSSFVNISEYGDILGFNPKDALFYRTCGERFVDSSYLSFIEWVSIRFPSIDDWGFPTIMWLTYKIFGISFGPWAVRILNAVVIAWGAGRLYKLSCRFLKNQEAKVVALVWGCMPFAVHAAANGAKENFFVFFIISFFYFLYRNSEKSSFSILLRLILYSGLIFMFRLATGYAAIICIITMYYLRKRSVQKNFSLLFTIAVGLAVFLFPVILDFVTSQRGNEEGFLDERNNAKAESIGGTIGFVVNTLSSFIGPIPCFISSDTDKLQFLTKYSFTPYVKILTSFFFYYAFVDILKNRWIKLMPMCLFSFINILLLIVAFFGLHVRMHWPHIPLYLIITYWGYKKYSEVRHKIEWYQIYLVFAFLLTIFYNYR